MHLDSVLTQDEKRAVQKFLSGKLPKPFECYKYSQDDTWLSKYPGSVREILKSVYEKVCRVYGLHQHSFSVKSTSDISSFNVYPYPGPAFHKKIFFKKEFLENAGQTKSRSDCEQDATPFQLLPHQRFARNFMSPVTPYRGLLLFHGVGSGKSASAITIAESFKLELQRNPRKEQRKVMILHANSTIEANFRKTIYDKTEQVDEQLHRMHQGARQVTGAEYYIADMTHQQEEAVRQRYEEYYDIISREKFTRRLRSLKSNLRKDHPYDADKMIHKEIANEFSNRLIIVDEVHNIKDMDSADVDDYHAYDALMDVVKNAENVRLLLMSATPCYNDPQEIIPLLNLLIVNDKSGAELKATDIFDNQQINGIDETRLKKSAFQIFRDRVGHYISFVRCSNPASFPTTFEVDDPRVKSLYARNILYSPKPDVDVHGHPVPARSFIKHTKLIRCPMSPQYYKSYLDNKSVIKLHRNVAMKEERDLCSMMYPTSGGLGAFGRKGFEEAFQLVKQRKGDTPSYRYKSHCKGFLSKTMLPTFSPKYGAILSNILLSPGISFVYSENVFIGVYTLAMLLDANGYESIEIAGSQAKAGSYLLDHGVPSSDKICALCNRPRRHAQHLNGSHEFQQAYYAILKGQEGALSNVDVLRYVRQPSNSLGHEVKVILGSPVTRESMDFKNIRQIHIASVWHNMSRVAQVIGRGVRNCSHSMLPENQRNVTVFRYCVSLPATSRRKPVFETADENMWRRSENKDIAIKAVERLMKMVAIDCSLNKRSNIKHTDKNYSRDCDYSRCNYSCVFEWPSKILADDVDYDTYPDTNIADEVNGLKFWIGRMFDTATVLTFTDIAHRLSSLSTQPVHHRALVHALDAMVGDEEQLPDIFQTKDGIYGYLIYVDTFYVFQPLVIKDRRIPVSMRHRIAPQLVQKIPLSVITGDHKRLQPTARDPATLINAISSEITPTAMAHHIDKNIRDVEHVCILEYIISKRCAAPFLFYYKDFLLSNDSSDNIQGHFLFNKSRVCHDGQWESGTVAERVKIDKLRSELYREKLGPYVGYIETKQQQPRFKLINNYVSNQKIRHDFNIAQNTISKGKDCYTGFNRVELNNIFQILQIPGTPSTAKIESCNIIEMALRELQFKSADSTRYFYNRLEWESGLPQANLSFVQ